MQIIEHVIISAAGTGSRLGMNMPKCLVDIGNKKIIDYILDLVVDIKDVRIVVGFMEERVIDYVRKIRNDVVFVRNPYYQTTSNSYSVHLATRDLNKPFLIIDGDMLIEAESFVKFISECTISDSLIGITESKTEEAVFVELDENSHLVEFTRERQLKYEWSGLAYLNNIDISKTGGYIYKELERYLPLKTAIIECYEIDTPEDLSLAINKFITINKKK